MAEQTEKPFHERFKSKPIFFEPNPVEKIVEARVDEPVIFTLGIDGVTLIEIYGEHGQMAMVPYVAVYQGEKCIFRANASLFLIFFKKGE